MQNQEDDAAVELDPLPIVKSPSEFAGQQLFIQGEDWYNNAMLGWTHFPWDIYAAGECCIPISAAIYPKRYCEKRLSSFLQLDDERYAIIAVLSVNCPVHPGQVHPGCVKPQTKLSAPVRVADAQLENTFTVFQ